MNGICQESQSCANRPKKSRGQLPFASTASVIVAEPTTIWRIISFRPHSRKMSASLPSLSNMCVNEQWELNAYTLTKVGVCLSFLTSSSVPFAFASFQGGDGQESITLRGKMYSFFFFKMRGCKPMRDAQFSQSNVFLLIKWL